MVAKLRERNEALDCRVYARAAAWIVGADRWSEARWADLEAQVAGDGMAWIKGVTTRPQPDPSVPCAVQRGAGPWRRIT